MEIIPASFYTEFSHSVKGQNDLKCLKKNMKISGKNAKFSEKKAIKMPSNLFWNCEGNIFLLIITEKKQCQLTECRSVL